MEPRTRDFIAGCLFVSPVFLVAALGCALTARPAIPEPTLNLQPGHTVTLASRQGDGITCPAPLSGDFIVCALPDGDKLTCDESDTKGVLAHCGQRWKWGWLAESVSNRWGPFGINSEALAEYEKKHPAQSPVNTVVGAPVFH